MPRSVDGPKRRRSYSRYNALQSTRPQTIAYALTGSPAGQLAWIVEKFKEWTDESKELPEQAVDRDQMLTNVTLYWLTRTAGPSAQIYYENMHSLSWAPPERSPVPTAVANFGQEVAIRRFAEPAHTPSSAGPSSIVAATSPPSRRPPCWFADIREFSETCAEPRCTCTWPRARRSDLDADPCQDSFGGWSWVSRVWRED